MTTTGPSTAADSPIFCSGFDEALAHGGPAAVFLFDVEHALRFDEKWTRDVWGRAAGPHEHGWRWVAVRDRQTGFVHVVLVTSPTLLPEHPRADLKAFETWEGARRFRDEHGHPPICVKPW